MMLVFWLFHAFWDTVFYFLRKVWNKTKTAERRRAEKMEKWLEYVDEQKRLSKDSDLASNLQFMPGRRLTEHEAAEVTKIIGDF